MGDQYIELNLNTEENKKLAKKALIDATREVFAIDIKHAAMEGSPVDTGTNKRSIDTETTETATGVSATLFTQSGYGGYLELGTRKMRARPYLYPAFEENVGKIIPLAKEKMDQ